MDDLILNDIGCMASGSVVPVQNIDDVGDLQTAHDPYYAYFLTWLSECNIYSVAQGLPTTPPIILGSFHNLKAESQSLALTSHLFWTHRWSIIGCNGEVRNTFPIGCSEGPIHSIVGQLLGMPQTHQPFNCNGAHISSHHTFVRKPCTIPLEDISTPTSTHTAYIILIWEPLSSFLLQQFLMFQHSCQPCLCWWSNAASMVSSQAETGDVESNLGMGPKKNEIQKTSKFYMFNEFKKVCFMPSKKDVWMTVGDLTPMRLKKVKSRPKITQKMDQGNNQQYFNPKKNKLLCP